MPLSDQTYQDLERAGEQIKKREAGRVGISDSWIEIVAWMCPTPGCGNYYGASDAPDLSTEWTGARGLNFEPTPAAAHTRAQCPDCKARGVEVERVPVRTTVRRPAPITAPPNPYVS